MRRAVLVVVLALSALAAVAPARADVRVSSGGFGVFLTPEGDGRWRVIVEHFADESRNGVRVRQIGTGDPRISSFGDSCSANFLLNDVVCNAVPTLAQMDANDAVQELVVGGSNVGCESGPRVGVLIRMGGGDDIVRPSFACGGQANVTGTNRLSPQMLRIAGGGGAGNDTLTGGRLDDEIQGDEGNDVINGGTADDTLMGGTGNDTLNGQGGDDTLTGDAGADVLDGGGQTDTVRYDILNSVTVTLDGSANDGRSGEGDNLRDIETVITGAGNDRITGSSDDETLDGGAGADVITGGAGTDSVRGAAGNDLIDVRENNEGIRDVVNCGTGVDEVIADLADIVAGRIFFNDPRDAGCERVERFAVDDGPPGRVRARSVAIAGDGALTLRVSCPRRARVTCRGTLRLADNRRLGRTLARARYSVARRSATQVRLKLTRAQARKARARRSITAITRERGVSKKGPRSAITTLAVSRRSR